MDEEALVIIAGQLEAAWNDPSLTTAVRGGHFTRGLNRHEVEEVVAIVDNTLLQERREAS